MKGAFASSFDNVTPMPGQPVPIRPHVPDASEFPIDALSPKLQRAARAIMDVTQAPAAICAQSVIGAAALGVQPYFDVILPTGDQIPTSLFLVTVAQSGERKSATDKHALRPVRDREAELYPDYLEAQTAFATDAAAYSAARKKAMAGSRSREAIKDALEQCGEEPRPPATPLLVTDEGTLAGLQKLFAEAMPSLGLFSDEGGQMLTGHAMQDENRIATGAALSKLWDGAPIKRVRVGDGITILRGRRLSSHLMIQGRIARKLFGDQELASQGLLSRMLVCFPKTRFGERSWREASPQSWQDLEIYRARLTTLLRSPMPMDPHTRELSPRTIELSPEAREMFISWHDAVESQLGKGGQFEKITGFAAKLPEHSVRLAAVMACFDDRNVQSISGQALAAGITLAKYYAAEALRLFGVGASDEDTENADAIIKWVREEKLATVGKRFLGRYGPGRSMDGRVRQRAIQLLEEMKHLVPISGGAQVTHNGKTEFNREAFTVIADEGEDA